MDLQFYGANCIVFSYKGTRIVIDDNMVELGAKAVIKSGDVALFTTATHAAAKAARLVFDGPGEYEVADISIVGLGVRAHIDGPNEKTATMFKLVFNDQNILVAGHVYPDLSEAQLEAVGMIDVLIVPVGGSGYTLDPIGALKLIKDIEPKLVIPTHYDDTSLNYPVPQLGLEAALKELGMEPKETTSKLRLKPGELTEVTQLIVLDKI